MHLLTRVCCSCVWESYNELPADTWCAVFPYCCLWSDLPPPRSDSLSFCWQMHPICLELKDKDYKIIMRPLCYTGPTRFCLSSHHSAVEYQIRNSSSDHSSSFNLNYIGLYEWYSVYGKRMCGRCFMLNVLKRECWHFVRVSGKNIFRPRGIALFKILDNLPFSGL